MADAETPAKLVESLTLGNLVMADFAIDIDPEERLDLLVTRVGANGVRDIEARFMGVLVRKLAVKPNSDGTTTWTAI